MKRKWRRYELLLPNQFNDGRRVPDAWLAQAVNEVNDHFGAASFDKEKVQGQWRSGDKVYRDILSRLVVDVPDTPQNRQWMRRFKAKWKKKLDQLEIWMVSYRIDVE